MEETGLDTEMVGKRRDSITDNFYEQNDLNIILDRKGSLSSQGSWKEN